MKESEQADLHLFTHNFPKQNILMNESALSGGFLEKNSSKKEFKQCPVLFLV